MTREELDVAGFALVIARLSLMQMASIATAMGDNASAAKCTDQMREFEMLQVKIACGVIQPTEGS